MLNAEAPTGWRDWRQRRAGGVLPGTVGPAPYSHRNWPCPEWLATISQPNFLARSKSIRWPGRGFDFTALTEVEHTVPEEVLEDVAPATIAGGVRDLDSAGADPALWAADHAR